MLMLLSEYMAHIRMHSIYGRKRRNWWTICICIFIRRCCCLFMRPTFRLRYHHHCCVLVRLMNANALLLGSGVLIYMLVYKRPLPCCHVHPNMIRFCFGFCVVERPLSFLQAFPSVHARVSPLWRKTIMFIAHHTRRCSLHDRELYHFRSIVHNSLCKLYCSA